MTVTLFMSDKGFELLWNLAEEGDIGLEDVFGRSLILYEKARRAVRSGQAVGVASNPEVLDVEFVDL